MLSKADILKEKILGDIAAGALKPGESIPTRHSLMRRYGNARATVDAAVGALVREGYLFSVQGSGTFVAKPRQLGNITKAYVLDDSGGGQVHGESATRLAADIQDRAECRIIPQSEVKPRLDELVRPGVAAIWLRPQVARLETVEYLDKARVPQILIGRPYPEFNFIATDARAGVDAGFAWFKDNHVRTAAFLGLEPNPALPYVAERQLAFYHCCLAHGVQTATDLVFTVGPRDPHAQLNLAARRLFAASDRPEGIFVAYHDLLLPLLSLAESLRRVPGKDFFILAFDHSPAFDHIPGLCMLRQRWGRMGRLAINWLFNDASKKERFSIFVEPRPIVAGQPLERDHHG